MCSSCDGAGWVPGHDKGPEPRYGAFDFMLLCLLVLVVLAAVGMII